MNNEEYIIICVDLGLDKRFTINILDDNDKTPFQISYNCEKCSGKGCDSEKNIGGMFLFDQCVDGRIIRNINLSQLKEFVGQEKFNIIAKSLINKLGII